MKISMQLDFDTDKTQDLMLAREVSGYFHVKPDKATEIIKEVVKAVKGWRKEAVHLGISAKEQDEMESAFRACKLERLP